MSYPRVIPRDLFNEANLLKCLGKISLMVHEGRFQGKINIDHEDASKGFKIVQNPHDGSISVSNLHIYDNNATPLHFFHPLNCKESWALCLEYKGETYYCFDERGNFMPSLSIFP